MAETSHLANTETGLTNFGPFGAGLSLFSPWAGLYNSAPSEEEDEKSIETVLAAIRDGVTLLDSATFYGVDHHGLKLLAKILKRVDRQKVIVSVKFGAQYVGKGMTYDMSRANVRREIELTLSLLDTPYIDIFTPTRADPATPMRETIDEIAKLVTEGKVKHIGLSEVTPANIREAASVSRIACLQTEYGPMERSAETDGTFDACRDNGIVVLAYGVIQHGFLSDKGLSPWEHFRDAAARTFYPRFHKENYEHNQQYLRLMSKFIDERGLDISIGQLAVAYIMRRSSAATQGKLPAMVPLIGMRSLQSVHDNLHIADVAANKLTDDDVRALQQMVDSFQIRGERYPPHVMKSIKG